MELDETPTFLGIKKICEQVKRRKAAGINIISLEIWKYDGHILYSKLHELLISYWEQQKLRQDFRDTVIITIYKNKGGK